MNEEIVISIAACARRCGVRPSLLRHWLKQGVIPGLLLGNARVQLTPAVLAALSKRKW
ncbi:MAG TPA: hypothetical protein PKH77_09715 [Anaerolineae bacterium]|nr:hypothetical protein [Anaerolineae bacterium]